MFDKLDMAPPDPILGLTEAFLRDTNPAKINLSVGVYKDAAGKTPVLECVKKAEEKILRTEDTKSYKPIHGAPEFGKVVREMLFGVEHDVVTADRAVTAHAPGGTGALRVAANYVHDLSPGSAVWLSDPTWANHPGIFRAAGLEVKKYPYFDASTNSIDFEAMLGGLGGVAEGDVVVLHGCCHNPTGVDPTPEQWARVADLLGERRALPLVDFAYQGFADGLEEDAAGVRAFARPDAELLVASSFSKNFGLYNERVGALTLVARSASAANAALSHLKLGIRTNYSNPPAHGGAIVTTIVEDPELRPLWERELRAMRDRINGTRELFVETLAANGVKRDFSFIRSQRGMFSFSGLTEDQVRTLREKHSIYIVSSGRINVAGMTPDNMDTLCEAIAGVL